VRRPDVTVLLLSALLATADAADGKGTGRVDTAAVAARLVKIGTPDALATAALLKQFGSDTDTGAYALAVRAVAGAPQRADLAWLAVRLCDSADECDPEKPEEHLRDLDPANAAGWVGALARAQRSNDVAGVDAALSALANAKRFNVYFEPLVVATTRQLLAARNPTHGKPDPHATAAITMTMIGIVATTVLPGTKIFSYSCQGYELQITGRMDRCRNAARTLARSDAYIVEGLGLSLQQNLWPVDSAEGHAITDRRRVFQYRLEQFNRLNVSSSDPAEFPPDYLDVARAHPREQDVALEYFARAHVPIDPPPGWSSSQLPRVP
jgi:hypothetical protein